MLTLNCDSTDIEACHRLPLSNYERRNNKCKRTICRFVNRKFCVDALKSRKKLRQVDLSIVDESLANHAVSLHDNLCDPYKALLGMCKTLCSKKKSYSCWSLGSII